MKALMHCLIYFNCVMVMIAVTSIIILPFAEIEIFYFILCMLLVTAAFINAIFIGLMAAEYLIKRYSKE